jgi:catechol 2,3-dioxygenase-like lactoylglutathione lyase family enzyme
LKVTIQDVAVVSVPVADQERAKRFYVDTLGFELIEEVSAPDLHWIQVAPKGASTSLTLVDWFESMPAGSLNGLVLMSSNLRSDYEELVAKGVRFDAMSWAAHVLREQGMPLLERHAVFGTDDPRTLRQYLDLHRERLEERLMDQRAVLECIEGLLTETIRTRSPETATGSVDEATCVRDRARDRASAVEA